MTQKDLTLLAVLVDRSGSMSSCRTDMEGGLNQLIEDQRTQPGQLDLAIAQFDTSFDIVRPMGRLNTIHRYELIPRGTTALLDAMGKYITDIGGQLASQGESDRPAKVIMLIVTDGLENSSREWKKDAIKALVEQQQSQWAWEFMFLGANMDAIAEGQGLGIQRGSSLTFDTASSASVMDSYAVASNSMSDYRSGLVASAANFTDDDREKVMKHKKDKTTTSGSKS